MEKILHVRKNLLSLVYLSLSLSIIAEVLQGALRFSSHQLFENFVLDFFLYNYAPVGIKISLILMLKYRWKGSPMMLPGMFLVCWASLAGSPFSTNLEPVEILIEQGISFSELTGLFAFGVIILVDLFVNYRSKEQDPFDKSGQQGKAILRGQKGNWRFFDWTVSLSLILSSGASIGYSSLTFFEFIDIEGFMFGVYNFGMTVLFPVLFNGLLVVLVLRQTKGAALYLLYLLIPLWLRAFVWRPFVSSYSAEGFFFIVGQWVDRALVVLILVNTVWSLLNWLKLRSGLPKANV